MSKVDMLGPVSRALVAVPKDRLGLVLDVAQKLSMSGKRSADFSRGLKKFLRESQEKKILISTGVFLCRGNKEVVTSIGLFEECGVRNADDNFTEEFRPMEIPSSKSMKVSLSAILEKEVAYKDLIAEIGGEEKAVIPVGAFMVFLATHKEERQYYVFFLRGISGSLHPVFAFWNLEYPGWFISLKKITEKETRGTILVHPA